ncbi:auxilin-related protein 1-like [Rutidosis leptorrhynchoides]|uniref:auxilin-related protein 1-like n=1 Tax=Rutidosis leptorrhynchoides TaxID=125765 RepID=UPI003A9A491B
MDDFGMLAKDFGYRPQGKSAPMKSTGVDRRNRPNSPFNSDGKDVYNDLFGGSTNHTNVNSKSTPSMSDFDYDSIFNSSTSNNDAKSNPRASNSNNSPVYDKPLYDDDDDDIFDGLPGMKSKQVPSSASVREVDDISASIPKQSDQFDDLLGSLGRTAKAEPIRQSSGKSPGGLDDLIPGFGTSSPASSSRWRSDPSPTSTGKAKEKSNAVEDPFVILESMSTPIGKSRSSKSGISSPSEDLFGDISSLNSSNKPAPASTKEANNRKTGQTHSEEGSGVSSARSSVSKEPLDESFFGYSESQPQKTPLDDRHESHQTVFDMPPASRHSRTSFDETNSPVGTSPKSDEHVRSHDDIWLTVSEIPLFTPITSAPPPSRPPPPIPRRARYSEKESFASTTRTSDNDSSSSSDPFKYSQYGNASRNREPTQVDMNEWVMDEEITREREREEERRLERERMREAEREKARQAVERANREARERAATEARLKAERAAVQRAQTEARERAAVEARERAERSAAEAKERAAAEKAAVEAREKEALEKAAVAKAQADARRRAERAAVERVTAEARERAAAEARERVAAEARERATAEARERAAAVAATKLNQRKNDNDLDAFFSTSSQPNSVPRARESSGSATDPLSQDKQGPDGAHGASNARDPSSVRKASSTTNFVDDLSSIFGAPSPAGEFQDVECETEDRRRARLERQQRTQERAAKALAEKNQRDMQIQKEQEERQRVSYTLDVEIKRWSAGKEGNLRAMLSTLQYVLWPECGWQPISLTDLITGANVKKAYRKATLCIHPDKVQQKGANLQQKYVAEKVFDLLKEAWNKFNSEELF